MDSLCKHLQWALELEHCTIPPYLAALYSLHEGHNREAAGILLSVVIEEMLHMTLVANVLNAVGGQPRLDHPEFVPQYPCYMPHSNQAFLVNLSRLSRESVETFMRIEKPEEHFILPEDDIYETIGQFYETMEEGLGWLCRTLGAEQVFTGDPARQMKPTDMHYDGSGNVVVVTDLTSALAALDEIKGQGEGINHKAIWDGDRKMFHPTNNEISHYFRFNEIYMGKRYAHNDTPQTGPRGRDFPVDWTTIYNCRTNPKKDDYPQGSLAWTKMHDFNETYSDMLRLMHKSFNGEPHWMAVAIGLMYELKIKAIELMKLPSGDGETTVGFSFEYVRPLEKSLVARNPSIRVRPNGPYIVDGGVTIVRKSRVMSEHKEALTWKKEKTLTTAATCALCRCGQSGVKPFCDGSHVRLKFDGTETAEINLRIERAKDYPGTKIMVRHDSTICAFATFCENKITDVWRMSEETTDSIVRAQVMSMIERCPSGALTYELEEVASESLASDNDSEAQQSAARQMKANETGVSGSVANEPDLPREISVITDGPLWVTGGIPMERADGKKLEIRNRMTLCRCGHSKNKPLCDGSHTDVAFKD